MAILLLDLGKPILESRNHPHRMSDPTASMSKEEASAYSEALRRIESCVKSSPRDRDHTTLDLSGLGLTQIPPLIWTASRITILRLHHNNLATIPSEIGSLTNIKELSLSDNHLKSVPSDISLLVGLTELYLNDNELCSLPSAICNLSRLEILYLNHNCLNELPPEIGRLTSLRKLFLYGNKLRTLPVEIGNLAALSSLYLEDNELTSLPESIREIPKLELLYLHRNDGLGLPREVLGAGWRQDGVVADPKYLLDFYFSLQSQGERPLNEVKLLLVGRGESGKTSVSKALRGEEFDREQRETPGIEIKAWPLKCSEGDEVKVHVWDFAGQEITHETHRFFLTERSLYLVVLDGRGGQQMEEAEYWLSHVERYGSRRNGDQIERSPVIIVLNKWQSPGPYDVEQRRLQREYSNIFAFVQTDCVNGFGIAALRDTVCAALGKIPAVRQKWPVSYFDLRQKLANLVENPDPTQRRHFLKWEAYREVCAACGVTEQDRQHSMAENLNALGVALYYGDDDRLRDTRVLNPNWAANGLYGLVRGVQRLPYLGNRGHLWAGDFPAVLAEGMQGMDRVRGATIEDYPEERDEVKVHEFLLQLMVDRELGFQADTIKGQPLYLLPSLLTLDEPEVRDYDVAAHMDAAEVRFRYLYELLPAGVMSRFIVRTHSLSEGLHRWQRGVVLGWGNAKALVMAERRRNPRIDVYVRGGTAAERQELAGVVRSNMEAIHYDLPIGLRGKEELDLTMPGEQYESVEKLERLEEANQPVQVVTSLGPQQLPVTPQLEQVQPAKARRRTAPKLKIFVSYSHANYKVWDRLKPHLDILKNERLVSWWFDGKIRPGSEWDDAIRKELKEADIVLLLLSNDFFASKYIKGVELKEARRKQQMGEAEILPILLEPSEAFANQVWLKKLQTIPSINGQLRPLTSFNPAINGWNEVQKALREMISVAAARKLSRER